MFFSRLGRFLGPWLAYAALSGAGGAFSLGALVTLYGLAAGVFMLFGGAVNGAFPEAVKDIVRAFPFYGLAVLYVSAFGFAGGFITGLIAGLVGGIAGFWWSAIAVFGLICLTSPLLNDFHQLDTTYLLLPFGATGIIFSNQFLAYEGGLAEPLSRWMRGTWLSEPSAGARLAGILLPVLFWMAVEVGVTAPIYTSNQNYVARLGAGTTWWNSRRFATTTNYMRRTSCQSNLKQIMLGVKQYSMDYDEFFPPRPTRPQDGAAALIYPYMKSTQIFQCPAEFYQMSESGSSETAIFQSGDFCDYWINARTYGRNECTFAYSALTVVWGDGNTRMGEGTAAYSLTNIPTGFKPATRHKTFTGGANYTFADGHVKWLLPGLVSNSAAPGSKASTYTMVP